MEGLCEGGNVGNVYSAQLKLRIVNLIGSKKRIIVVIMGDINICHLLSCARSPRAINIELCLHLSNPDFYVHG